MTSKTQSVLFLAAILLSAFVGVNSHDFLTLSRPGSSPSLTRISPDQNRLVSEICGIDEIGDYRESKDLVDGDEEARVGQFPWAVAFSNDHITFCGGTMIGPKHILTAAHCFHHYEKASVPCKGPKIIQKTFDVQVHYGGICTRAVEQTPCTGRTTRVARLSKVLISRRFHDGRCENGSDVAIAEIEGEFEFDASSRPICLSRGGEALAENSFVNFGFGADQHRQKNGFLRYVRFNSKSVDVCPHPRDNLCVQPDSRFKSVCQGDSGSGFQARRLVDRRVVLNGIVSFGPKCGDGKRFQSTSVGSYLSEICALTGICML